MPGGGGSVVDNSGSGTPGMSNQEAAMVKAVSYSMQIKRQFLID